VLLGCAELPRQHLDGQPGERDDQADAAEDRGDESGGRPGAARAVPGWPLRAEVT
jgi:hypothetical protein